MQHDGLEVESKILSVLRRKTNYYKYKALLKEDFFQIKPTKEIFSLIVEYFESTYHAERRLSVMNLRLLIHKRIKNKELKEECLDLSKKIRKIKTKDNEIIESLIRDFTSRQSLKQGILSGLEELEKPIPNLIKIQDSIQNAILVANNQGRDHYNYFEEPEERIVMERNEKRTMTGIPKLDDSVDGGFGRGELIVFLAPPERGKTLALVNIGAAALHQGKRVAFLTLELSERKVARRFDLRITGRPIESLRREPTRIKNPLAALRRNGCDLIIKDYSAEDPKIEDIKSFIVNYQSKTHKKFDMLIIDYADLISPSRAHKQERFGIKEVYKDLRRIANEFKFPIVTASQANRKSLENLVITMKDFDECFAKAAIADVVIGICQTPEEREDELVRLYIAKNRNSGKHLAMRLSMKPTTMFMGEFDRGIDNSKEKRKTVADRI